MKAIFEFLTGNLWRAAALGLALAFAAAAVTHLVIVADLKTELADEVKAHATCKGNVTTLSNAIDMQNAAIRQWEAEAEARRKRDAEEAERRRQDLDRRREAVKRDGRSGADHMNSFIAATFGG